MSKLSKKLKEIYKKYNFNLIYSLNKASKIIKEISSNNNFNSSIDISINLGIDYKKSNQMIRGVVKLPYGTGKNIRVLAIVGVDKELEAKESGADYFGSDKYLDKISKGWIDIDTIITTPNMMPKFALLGKILGPRGLMPNYKNGTVTIDIGKAIKEVKLGKIDFKTDRYGIIHSSIGRTSFEEEKIKNNIKELIKSINKLRPSSTKGIYIKTVFLSGTMSPSIQVDTKSI